MTNTGSIIVAWGVMVFMLGTYVLWVLARGRALAERVPADRQRWMTSASPKPDRADGS